jgi:hypothetical protein
MDEILGTLSESVAGLEKKWKDLNKVVLAKLSLLDKLLQDYQMDMSPIDFLYTVSLCGQWHPAAVAHFSQHWSDQGIARLKSDVDSSSKLVVRVLQLECLPLATNLGLWAR